MTRRPPRRRRVPTALLALATIVALLAAGWLFAAGGGDDPGGSTPDVPEPDREQAEGVLDLPDEEEPTDARRRGGEGRDRLDDPDDEGPSDPEDAEEAQEDLPAIAANLEGVRVAVGTASAPAPGNVQRRVAIGGLRVRCADAVDRAREVQEAAVVAALTDLVERAGGRVERSDAPPACVDERARRLHRGTLGVVVSAQDGRLATAGRAARGEGDRGSRTLASELAATLDLDAPTPAELTAARRRATSGGAIDLPGGAAVAWVEFDAGLDEAGVEELARALLQGLAATAARADVNPG